MNTNGVDGLESCKISFGRCLFLVRKESRLYVNRMVGNNMIRKIMSSFCFSAGDGF